MAPIKWNAPTIALTVNAILVGLAGLASLSGALPPPNHPPTHPHTHTYHDGHTQTLGFERGRWRVAVQVRPNPYPEQG